MLRGAPGGGKQLAGALPRSPGKRTAWIPPLSKALSGHQPWDGGRRLGAGRPRRGPLGQDAWEQPF